MASLRANKPFWSYFGIFLIQGVAQGILLTVAFTFYDSYLRVGEWLPYLATSYVVVMTASVPIWLKVSYYLGKHRSWAISWMIHVLVMQGFWFVPPGPDALWGVAFVMMSMGLSSGANVVCAPAILADIVDYGTWKTGAEQTGNYFAFQLMGVKIVHAVGGALGFYLLAFWGFEVQPEVANDSRAIVGLLTTYIGIPSAFFAASILLMWHFPLNARRHAIIRRRIELRSERTGRTQARANA
jgi:Na+/melibiose symporter-like transporter